MRAELTDGWLEYEDHGDDRDPPLLLVAGINQQLTSWSAELIAALVGAGLRVIAYDHRDVGLSSTVDADREPDVMEVIGGDHAGVVYSLSDMAADAAALLDALQLDDAHVLAHSMGGAIAQRMAVEHPGHIRSLTLFGASPGDGTGGMDPDVLSAMLAPAGTGADADLARAIKVYTLAAHPVEVEPERLEAYCRVQTERWVSPRTFNRQMAATVADGDRSPGLTTIPMPTRVIHGDGDLFVAPDGGESLSSSIPQADLRPLEGMGHMSFTADHDAQIVDAVRTLVDESGDR